jgi:hypothetical protein
MTLERKKKLNKLIVIIIYVDTRSFILYECLTIKEFFFKLNLAYKPLFTDLLTNKLFNELYINIKE